MQLKTKWLRWLHPTARLSGGSVQGPAALLMAEDACTGCRALTSWSREHGQPQLGDERVRATHRAPALCQHAKALLCQQLKPCQRATGSLKQQQSLVQHLLAMPQSPACAPPPPRAGLCPKTPSATATDPGRLGSLLGTDTTGSVAASTHGEILISCHKQREPWLCTTLWAHPLVLRWAQSSPCSSRSRAVSCVYCLILSTPSGSHRR